MRLRLTSVIALVCLALQLPAQGIVKIMPMGDSVTSARKDHPSYRDIASYRYYLWHQLKASGRCVDFVGTEKTILSSAKPQFNDFDRDVEAVWGRTADQTAAGAYAAAKAVNPDIALIHSGSVDTYLGQTVASTVQDLEKTIDELRRANPKITILLAQLIKFGAKWKVDVAPLNKEIPGIATRKSTTTSPVIVVDHFAGWDPDVHTFDGVHPFESGERRMADKWHAELIKLIPKCNTGSPSADFEGSPTSGDAPLTVNFTDKSSGNPTAWTWDLGDGTGSTLTAPSHIYTKPGVYTVKLTAANANGSDTATKTDYVVVRDPNVGKGIRVMPLGDSITEARHLHASYRYFLWHDLAADGYCVDFVGSLKGVQGKSGIGHNGTPKYPNFDQDHESRSGWRADEIAANAYNWALAAKPDVVLLHAGSNDLFQKQSVASTVTDLEKIIDELRRASPFVKIFLSQLIPFGAKYTVDVKPLNKEIPGIAARKNKPQSPICVVDHFTGFDPTIHEYDDVHPNELGEQRMAANWLHAIRGSGAKTCKAITQRIMPLGSSITVARNGHASYRFFLWQSLKQDNYCVDFVGSKKGVQSGQPKFPDFDQDYEGGWGIRADVIAANAYAWAKAQNPHIVILHAGVDDLYEGQTAKSTADDICKIIDELRRANPNVRIALSNLTPAAPKFGLDWQGLNTLLPGVVAKKHLAHSPVVLVDNASGWSVSAHTYNGVHPNFAGDSRLASNYHKAIAGWNTPKCGGSDPKEKVPVMPLGSSLTVARSNRATYRYFLWNQLTNSGHCVDFVGSKKGVQSGSPKFPDFDQDYEGGWGIRADVIAANAYKWAVAAKPKVVLLLAGMDDLYEGQTAASTATDIEKIIDELRRADASVQILLGNLPPSDPKFKVNAASLNSLLPALVSSKSSPASQVLLVDHASGWNISTHTYNGVHANDAGEKRMADKWHDAFLTLKLQCRSTFASSGFGCMGTKGIPQLDVVVGSQPAIGSTFGLTLSKIPASAPAIGVLGMSNRSWNGNDLPFDLSSTGMKNCWLFVRPDILMPLTANKVGTANWKLPIPVWQALVGQQFFLQAFVNDPGSNNLGVTLSNSQSGRVGQR